MYDFRSIGGATFSYSVSFADVDYANISFFDPSKKRIIFHLSLRRAAGLAVVNARHNDEWRGEIAKQVDLGAKIDLVVISFLENRVMVTLDGAEIFFFENDFTEVDTIQYANFTGGIQNDSIHLEGSANINREGKGEILLGEGLEVSGWAVDPGLPQQSPMLGIDGLNEPILFGTKKMPHISDKFHLGNVDIGIHAALPGRIWECADADETIVLRVSSNGIPCGQALRLNKSDVIQKIEDCVAKSNVTTDMYPLLLALEHVRFGKLWNLLSSSAKAMLRDAANMYGVQDFLNNADEAVAAETFQAPPENPTQVLSDLIRSNFGERIAKPDSPAAITVLSALLKHHPLPPDAQQQLFLTVCEAFCNRDAFSDLYDFAATQELHSFKPRNQAWYDSVILPFLYMEGRLDIVLDVMSWLAETKSGWVITPALGTVVRDLVTQPRCEEKAVEDILNAFMRFVDKRRGNYWERTPCKALITASVEMVRRSDKLSGVLQQNIETFVLRNYGLSQYFWESLQNDDTYRLQGYLEPAAVAFAQIQDRFAGKSRDISAALDFFESYKNPDAGRFRLELLGMAGVVRDTLLPEIQLLSRNPQEDLLRRLAFPGAKPPKPSEALTQMSRRMIRARHKHTPKSPYYELQLSVSRDATALLCQLAKTKDAAVETELRSLLGNMTTLSSLRSKHLGVGMILALQNGLIRLGCEDLATQVLAHLSMVRASLPIKQHAGLFDSPVIQSALSGLAITAKQTNSAMAQATLGVFPNFNSAQAERPDAEDRPAVSALFDTIVTVVSCNPNLDSRIDPMRQGWLEQLKALGIPYVVVVGDGNDHLEGDILRLDAPDTYEGLPQKILKTVKWVHDNTPYSYMLKIDDDCFLNVDEFFHSLSYRKFDYYGRRLIRVVGQTDRSWHFSKSQSARGRKELDKSPEPSEYADGGSGYALSRRAMRAVLDAAGSTKGQFLASSSFMEDKLIGDLLSMNNIRVQEEDCYVSVMRRTYSDAVPVSLWENSFAPSQICGTKLVHLDSHVPQQKTLENLAVSQLRPAKIWPTFAPARLGPATNLLELLSDEKKLLKLNKEPLAVVSCLRNEMLMLPSFLAHYRKLGVKSFLIADNTSDDGSLEYLLKQPDVAVFSVDTFYKESQYGVAWQMAILANLRVGRWSLLADADEFLTYTGWKKKPLPKLLAGGEFKNADAVRLYMLDMYPKGPLSTATFESGDPFAEAGFADKDPFLRNSTGMGSFSDSPTVTSALRHRLLPGSRPELFVSQKYALLKYKPWMRPSAGLHYVADLKLATQEMIFAHFKYNAHFRAKAEAEVSRGQHFNNAEEYRKYLSLVSEGRDVVYDPEVSVPWLESPEIRRILGLT